MNNSSFASWGVVKIECLWFLIFLCFLLFIPFSPHLTFFFSTLLLLTGYGKVSYSRNAIIIVALLMILFTASSRQIGFSTSDDLINTYMPIYNSQDFGYGIFSTDLGIELGYVFYVNILNVFFSHLTERQVLACSMLGTLSLYYIWFVFFLLPRIEDKYKGLISAAGLLAIQVGMLSQFLRQEFATPVLLMSLFYLADNAKKKSVFFLLLATLIHSSSLIIYIVFCSLFILKGISRLLVLLAIFLFSLAVFKSPETISSILTSAHLEFIAKKVAYYEVSEKMEFLQALSIGKFYFLIIIIFIIYRNTIDRFKGVNKYYDRLLTFCFWGAVFNLSFLILPNAARLFLVIPGFLLPVILYPIIKKQYLLFLIILVIYIVVGFFFPQRLFAGGTEGFYLWDKYDWINTSPFYYIYGVIGV